MYSILIIVPTKNSYKTVKKLVSSLNQQTDQYWRVIFIDYKSDKFFKNYLKNLCQFNKKFSIIEQISDTGIYGAMNIGFELIQINEWILFWGSDDYAFNNKSIENIRKEIKTYNSQDLIIFQGRFVNHSTGISNSSNHFSSLNTQNINAYKYKNILFKGFRQPHQGTLINPRNNLKSLKYNTKFTLAADLNFYLDCTKIKNLKVRIVRKNIVNIGEGGISRRKNIVRFKEVINIYFKYFKFLFFVPFVLRYIKC